MSANDFPGGLDKYQGYVRMWQMARAQKQQKVLTVGALKKFLEDIPDKTPIRGNFDDERMEAIVWKADKD